MSTEMHPPALWEFEWTFGDRLRKARRVLGLSMQELATALEVSTQAVSSWETRPNTPRGAHAIARRIELAYGVPAWWLLGLPHPGGGGGRDAAEWAPKPAVKPFRLVTAA